MAHGMLHRLAQAGADNDALAEEHGIDAATRALGLEPADLLYVAEQRALRAVMVERGPTGRAELAAAQARGSDRPQGFRLTPAETLRMRLYQALYMDGIALGLRAAGAD